MLSISLIVRFTRTVESFPGFWSLWLFHVKLIIDRSAVPRVKLSARDLLKLQAERSTPTAHEARILRAKSFYQLDPTKRKSLQPTNQEGLPKGWDEAVARPDDLVKRPMPLTAPLEDSFHHVFYGSMLRVGDVTIASGLSKTTHKLEITKDQLLIDGHPQAINQGDLERIKDMLRSTR